MKRIIYLKDHKESVLQECKNRNSHNYYTENVLLMAIEANVKDGLRYHPFTGKTFSNSIKSCVSEYVYECDIPTYDNEEEAAIWAFSGFVRNSASRYSRGYSLI